MFNKLEEIIKKAKGNVLVIGLDDKLIDKFEKNNKVNLYAIYSNNDNATTNPNIRNKNLLSKQKKKKTNKGKIINIKRLRKYISKKSVDFFICNFEEIMQYYKYIIKDTIYLNRNIIYIYSTNKIDKEFIMERYKRYNVEISFTEYKNGYIIVIDSAKAKNNFFKDKLYFIKDTLYNLAEIIGNVMIG